MAGKDVQKTLINIKWDSVIFEHCYLIENFPDLVSISSSDEFIKLSKFPVAMPNSDKIFFNLKLYPCGSMGEPLFCLTSESELDHVLTKFEFSLLDDTNKAMEHSPCTTIVFNTTQRESEKISLTTPGNRINNYLYDNTLRVFIKGTVSKKITSPVNLTSYLKVSEKEIAEDLALLFETQELSDVTLLASGKEIKVHKAILAARSPVFKAMFSHEITENLVEITDIQFEVLKNMLHFMYTGRTQTLTDNTMNSELLVVADKYAIPGLKMICEISLSENITIENAVQMIMLAHLNDLKKLRADTLYFIQNNRIQVIETNNWELLMEYPNLVTEILQ